MFELVLFNIKLISKTCSVEFNISKEPEIRCLKAYPVDKFELVLFSNTIICFTCTVVFNVPKVHEISCKGIKAFKHH